MVEWLYGHPALVELYSAVGEMNLHVPLEGDYKLEGTISYGENSDNNLLIEQKTISGESGTGEHSIHIEGNSNLNIFRSYPEQEEGRNSGAGRLCRIDNIPRNAVQ